MSITINIEKLNSYTYLVSTWGQEDLCRLFLRFQEHYESPEFKGKYFTLLEYVEWYKKVNGKFDYYKEYSGFNIPSYVLKPFIEGKFGYLVQDERRLVDYFKNIEGDYYIIGAYGKKKEALEHEMVHALYYMNPEYREKVNSILSSADIGDIISKLTKEGYDESVIFDEVNAYLVEKLGYIRLKNKKKDLVSKLRKLYEEYK